MKRFLLPAILILIISSCSSSDIYMDEDIPQSVRNEIDEMDQKVIETILNNDVDGLKTLMAKDMLEKKGDSVSLLVEAIHAAISSSELSALNQFYIKTSVFDRDLIIHSDSTEKDSYTINYRANTKESFASFKLIESGYFQVLMSVIYAKYDDEWKINIIHFGNYSVDGYNAVEYYEQAQNHLVDGHILDAFLKMSTCLKLLYPAADIWKYRKLDEMHTLKMNIIDQMNETYSFPQVISDLETKPQIFGFYHKLTDDGMLPAVEFLSQIPFSDSLAIEQEVEALHSIIESYFAGLTQNNESVLYDVYEEIPNESLRPKKLEFKMNLD